MLKLEEFAAKIRQSDQIVVFTGAGISTDSGMPDFRSPGGIWTRYRPVTFQEYMSCGKGFEPEAIINRQEGPLDDIADFVHNGTIGESCGRFGEMIADG